MTDPTDDAPERIAGPADPLAPAPAPDPFPADPRPGWWDRVVLWFGGHPPTTARQRARSRAIRRGVVAGGVLVVVGSIIQLPLLILSPGPTYNTIGEVDGEPLITISGTTTYPTDGALDMLTVSERGGSSGGVYLGEALVGWAAPGESVVPRESIYGPEVTGEEISERNDQLFALSQSDSIAAAMNELGIPTEEAIVVTVVAGGSPADGVVEPGDEIVSVNGKAVSSPADVGTEVRKGEIGDTVTLEVLRAEEPGDEPTPTTLEVVTVANPNPEDPDAAPAPYMGIVVGVAYEAPFDIEFADSNVGGPSAGMMFSLGIIDMLTEGQLNGGKHVAGTGTIDPEGNVGPIGGIQQKLVGARDAGAEIMLAPQDNCAEVVGNIPDGLLVVPVSTLGQARDTLETWVADPQAQFPQCGDGLSAAGR
ncbi:MAG: PDZ domain-containing protein [Candidatus Nanopelagicales bacterium]|nr:PDZ domain-containing protein [Candidatus Nanopelagicales bacterium]